MKNASELKFNKEKVSVVVPTYKEDGNVAELTRRIFATMRKANLECELIIMDDDSGAPTLKTVAIVKELHDKEGYNVRIRVRTKQEGKGLSSAVLLGLTKEAKNNYLLVMDADLQHEPESTVSVLSPILNNQADFAVGSRNVSGSGTSEDWPAHRRLISFVATLLARPLTTCTDPMSGFFALPRSTLERATYLSPTGWKIGLELMVRCKCTAIQDVPITFKDRTVGESKLTMKQNILYLVHLSQLYWFKYPVLVILFICFILFAIAVSLLVLHGVVVEGDFLFHFNQLIKNLN